MDSNDQSDLSRDKSRIQPSTPSDAKLTVEVDGIAFELPRGETLQKLAEDPRNEIAFGCFSGRCGFCRVRVLTGAENLNPKNEMEETLLPAMDSHPDDRLACQCVPKGPIAVSTKD